MPVAGADDGVMQSDSGSDGAQVLLTGLPVVAVVTRLDLELVVLHQDGVGVAVWCDEVGRGEVADEDGIRVDAEVVIGEAQLVKRELDDLLIDVADADRPRGRRSTAGFR